MQRRYTFLREMLAKCYNYVDPLFRELLNDCACHSTTIDYPKKCVLMCVHIVDIYSRMNYFLLITFTKTHMAVVQPLVLANSKKLYN